MVTRATSPIRRIKKNHPIMGWNPTVKYTNKLISISQISNSDEVKKQCRVNGTDQDHVNEIKIGIEAVGMKEPIDVEINNWDPTDFAKSTFIVRNGNHRFNAKRELKHKKIDCKVFEKNTSLDADLQWYHWQNRQNTHHDKIHLSNSFDDNANLLSKLLFANQLNKEATDALRNSDWNSRAIENGLRAWMKTDSCFAGLSKSKRDKIVEEVYAQNGRTYQPKIKRYTKSDKVDLLKKDFFTTGPGVLSVDGKRIVRTPTNNDGYAQLLNCLTPLIRGNKLRDPAVENIIVFSSNSTVADTIIKQRDELLSLAKQFNTWYDDHVDGAASLINKFYYLGQLLDRGEASDDLIEADL